jgi:hypothetical protein
MTSKFMTGPFKDSCKFMTGPFKDSCKFMTEEKLKEKGRNRKEKKRKKKKKRERRREPFHPAQRGRGASQPPCNSSSSLTDQHENIKKIII